MTEVSYRNNVTRILADGSVKVYTYQKKYKHKKQPVENEEEIKQMYNIGVPKSVISKKFNISVYKINTLLK